MRIISATDLSEARWWTRENVEDEDVNAHKKLIPYVQRLRRAQEGRRRANLIHASLYGNMQLLGLSANAYTRTVPSSTGALSLNVVKNMVNAVVSKVAAKSSPKVSYVTDGGDFDEHENALKLERGVEGVFYQGKFYRTSRKVFRHCAVFGTGFVKIYPDYEDRRVAIDPTFPWEIGVDDQEAMYGEPRTIVHWKYYDRGVAQADFPEASDEIARTARDTEDLDYGYDCQADLVLVTEAWHLPSGPGATDGRRTIVVENATLLDERWDKRRFPLPPLYWDDPLAGFFGDGLAEDLSGIQSEINKLLRQIQQGHHMVRGHYLVENSSKVVSQHLNNDLMAIVKFTGQPPQYYTPTIIAPEMYQHLWNLYEKAYEISAINQMAAQAQKPPGLIAAVAIREHADQQTERFLDVGKRFEEWVEECASLVVESAKDLAKQGSYEVRALDDDAFETIDWKELKDPDGFVLRVHPVSQLPGTPSGKMQYAQDMKELGTYTAEDLMEIIELPDTKAMTRRKLAPRRLVERSLSRMVKSGEYEAPEPFQNLDECMAIARDFYLMCREKNLRDDRLQLIRNYIVAARDEKKKMMAQDAPPPAPALPAGAPPPNAGPPMAMPPVVQPPGPPVGAAGPMQPPPP